MIHCKAGKGRTGLMICAYLLFCKYYTNPTDAMSFYAAMRTYNQKGVTIPSQIRYIRYFAHRMLKGMPAPQTYQLINVIWHSAPRGLDDIKIDIYVPNALCFTMKDQKPMRKRAGKGEDDGETLAFDFPPIQLVEDFQIEVTVAGKLVFAFWANTAFIENGSLVVGKAEMDKALKDAVSHKLYPKDMRCELVLKLLSAGDHEPENLKLESAKRGAARAAKLVPWCMTFEGTIHAPPMDLCLNGQQRWTEQPRHACTVASDLLTDLQAIIKNGTSEACK